VRHVSRGVPFSWIIYWLEKGLNLCQIDIPSGPINECERNKVTRHDIFIFRESEKSLTMDSEGVPFFVNNLQGPKKR
jgi:hypothetical protein